MKKKMTKEKSDSKKVSIDIKRLVSLTTLARTGPRYPDFWKLDDYPTDWN